MTQKLPRSPQPQSDSIEMFAQVAGRLSLAFLQYNIAPISQIELVNGSDEDINDITVTITSKPLFLHKKTFRFEQIKKGESRVLSPVPVDLDASFLSAVTGEVAGRINIVARAGKGEIAACEIFCHLVPPMDWPGVTGGPELIAGFVRPNDPAVAGILRNASEKLQQSGRSPVLDGYQSHNKGRTWELAEAIFAALGDEDLVLSLPRPDFVRDGQPVRPPSEILANKTADSLELVLLLAACLEHAGLDPLVGFNDGHVFCGLWLSPGDPSFRLVATAQSLRPRITNHDLILIETTMITAVPKVRFRTAAAKAAIMIAESVEAPLDVVVNIREARYRDITPQDGTLPAPIEAARALKEKIVKEKVAPAPESKIAEKNSRLDKWRRQLVGSVANNPLLNFKMDKRAVSLICEDPQRLELELARGEKFRLLPKPRLAPVVAEADIDYAALEADDAAARQHAVDALQRGEIHAHLSDEALQERLPEIYAQSREAFDQGQGNSLHLAIGFVSWRPQPKAALQKAPLILMPIALERRSVRSGFRLVRYGEDARINPALLYMLRRDFGLELDDFEDEFVSNAGGLNVAGIYAAMRKHLANLKQAKLTEEIVLANLSCSQFLIWRDAIERSKSVRANAVVAHLLEKNDQDYSNGTPLPDPRKLDAEIEPSNLWIPLAADAAQTAAVVAAAYGRDFVVNGPPGTGVSQTIANMIVQLLGDGKSVMFVSRKASALASVHQRLGAIGIGAFCLRIDGPHGQKHAVLAQMKAAWETRATEVPKDWYVAASDIKRLREKLNGFASVLHRPHRNGMSVNDAVSLVMRQKTVLPGLELAFETGTAHDADDMRRLRGRCREMQTALESIGSPDDSCFNQIGRQQWSPLWQKALLDAIIDFDECAQILQDTSAKTAALFDAPTSSHPKRIARLLTLFGQAIMPKARLAAPLLREDHARIHDAYFKWSGLRTQYSMTSATLTRKYRDGVFELNLVQLMDDWRKASGKLLLSAKHKRRVCDVLSSFTDTPVTDDAGTEIARLIDLKALRTQASSYDAILSSICAGWSGFNSSSEEIESLLAWETATRTHAKSLADADYPASYWLDRVLYALNASAGVVDSAGLLRNAVSCLYHDYRAFTQAHKALVELAETKDEWLGLAQDENWLLGARQMVADWHHASDDLQRWCQWRAVADAASAAGLSPLVGALQNGSIGADEVTNMFELAYARGWVMQIVDREPLLRSFVAEQHEDAIMRYQRLDDRVAELARQVVAGRLSGEIPSRASAAKVPEFALLANEIDKQSGQMPLRELFAQIPNALARLAPCLMTSPEAIARLLPREGRSFDVVILDEASQLSMGESLGALSRASQVIVLGDDRQLPPVCAAQEDTDQPEENDEGVTSLLQECLAGLMPVLNLRNHYRSTNERVFAFANQHFYNHELATFPPNARQPSGLQWLEVARGQETAGVNRAEAEALVAHLIGLLSDPDFVSLGHSIGVVTFTPAQKMLIERLLEKERHAFPGLEAFFGDDICEPVFVKDVQNAQGEVRDIIFLSTVFARDASGDAPADLGCLSSVHGSQYLNVAVSRARREMVVVSSLKAADLNGNDAPAAMQLAQFLKNVQTQPVEAYLANQLEPADSDRAFEDIVQKALETKGWSVHPRLGDSHQRVSLAILHPDQSGEYLAGIDCDSVRFAVASNARQRDHLRALVMHERGWNLHRVWAPDWWINADRALTRLHSQLEHDLAQSRLPPEERKKAQVEPRPHAEAMKLVMDEEPVAIQPAPITAATDSARSDDSRVLAEVKFAAPIATEQTRYQVADFAETGIVINRAAFYEPGYLPVLRAMVQHVVAVEGPIFADLLVHRIARAHYFARATDRIRDTVLAAVDNDLPQSVEDGRKIYWKSGANISAMPEFRASLTQEREFLDIPLPELAARVRRLLNSGASHSMIMQEMGKELHLTPMNNTARDRLGQAIRLAQFAGAAA